MTEMTDNRMRELKGLLQPAFLACVGVLLLAACGLTVVGTTSVKKEPLPLKKALSALDPQALSPYKVVNESTISSEDVVKALGTKEYIQWLLEDESAEVTSPVKYVSLFVTFYTGKTLDAVVHTPEACYLGGGNEPGDAYNQDISLESVKDSSGAALVIPVRCAVFTKGTSQAWENVSPFIVMYTFKVNGTYQRGRTATRQVLGGMSKHAYYAKVEWQFFGLSGVDRSRVYPSKDEATKASTKLLTVVLGELERSHWPDWETAEK